jgi:glutamyl-tRNA synthetase
VIGRIAAALDKKARDVARPFYVAITGSPTSIPLYDSMQLLGRDLVRERLRNAIDLLGAPSKRELQEWEALLARHEVAV